MAGRGTDIVLGGNIEKQIQFLEEDASLSPEEKAARAQKLKDEWQALHDQVKAAGGLRIVATERHESRHRQPAARPVGPPGRPRCQPFLPEPGRPADAHLRGDAKPRIVWVYFGGPSIPPPSFATSKVVEPLNDDTSW